MVHFCHFQAESLSFCPPTYPPWLLSWRTILFFHCLQNHPECKQKLIRSLNRTAEDHKAHLQEVKDRFFHHEDAHVAKARSERHKEAAYDIQYGHRWCTVEGTVLKQRNFLWNAEVNCLSSRMSGDWMLSGLNKWSPSLVHKIYSVKLLRNWGSLKLKLRNLSRNRGFYFSPMSPVFSYKHLVA